MGFHLGQSADTENTENIEDSNVTDLPSDAVPSVPSTSSGGTPGSMHSPLESFNPGHIIYCPEWLADGVLKLWPYVEGTKAAYRVYINSVSLSAGVLTALVVLITALSILSTYSTTFSVFTLYNKR